MRKLVEIKICLLIFFGLFLFSSCIVWESDYDRMDEDELNQVRIDIPFKNRTIERDTTGSIIVPERVLNDEGYTIERDPELGRIYEIKFQDKVYEFDYPLYHTYLFDDYIVFFTGMIGIESGFFRYFITPKHSQLITFKRDDFEFVNKKIIMGIVRNVKFVNGKLYFVVEKGNQRIYGRYPINDDD